MDKPTAEKLTIGLLIAAVFMVGFNFVQLNYAGSYSGGTPTGTNQVSGNSVSASPQAQINKDIIPKGVPKIYGAELGVSYDDVSLSDQARADATIKKLGTLDTKITLQGEELKRYTEIALKMSCEYCCGTDSIVFANGQPACGCAHSYAMRGVAKYLIQNHGQEFSDDGILEEMAKWKTLFFPGQISKKAEILGSRGIQLTYTNLASNKYRGIEK